MANLTIERTIPRDRTVPKIQSYSGNKISDSTRTTNVTNVVPSTKVESAFVQTQTETEDLGIPLVFRVRIMNRQPIPTIT